MHRLSAPLLVIGTSCPLVADGEVGMDFVKICPSLKTVGQPIPGRIQTAIPLEHECLASVSLTTRQLSAPPRKYIFSRKRELLSKCRKYLNVGQVCGKITSFLVLLYSVRELKSTICRNCIILARIR